MLTRACIWRIPVVVVVVLCCSQRGSADQVILDDLIVDGSACIGQDCVNGESFGFDTIRIKENNLRIKAQDTSSTASFPTQDWQITFNDSSNGGQNKYSIDAIAPVANTPFTIEAGSANSNHFYMDDGGRIGFGTTTPVAELHVKDGDTPTLRLEQDGSSGFTAQTWDVAGNEAGFFVRDATTGSTLPFRILPGAPSQALVVEGSTGDVGIGAGTNPEAALHVRRSNGTASITVEELSGTTMARNLINFENNGPPGMRFENTATMDNWRMRLFTGDLFQLVEGNDGDTEFSLDADGTLTLLGSCLEDDGANQCGTPDYVFEEDYEFMSLEELEAFIKANKHLPGVPSAAEVRENGFVVQGMANATLEKVEELVLYTLDQQKTINAQQETIEQQQALLKQLEARLSKLEAAQQQ